MTKIIKFYLLFSISLFAYEKQNICKKMEREFVASQLIKNQLKDNEIAFNILKQGSISSIRYKKQDCLSEKKYLEYMDYYLQLMLKGNIYYRRSPQIVEKLIKKYPNHSNFHLVLGDYYRKMFQERYNGIFRDKVLESYKNYANLKKRGVSKEILDYIAHNGLKKTDNTWGKRLNPQNKIPKIGFQAYYFNINEPKKIITSENVDAISVNYAYKSFHGIESHKFGAYWVGNLRFDKEEKKVITIDLSRSKVRIIIDGYILYEGKNSNEIPYTFKKGIHKIEVEFLNHWHTTDLMVNILPYYKKYSIDEIGKELKNLNLKDFELWYVGVYESRNKNHTIDLNIKKSEKPIVLLLNARSSVIWNIKNPYNTKIASIVLNGVRSISSVKGVKSKIIYAKRSILFGYTLPKECTCNSGYYKCSSGFKADKILAMFPKKKIRGFSGKYGAKSLDVPMVVLDDNKYLEIKEIIKKRKENRAKCVRDETLKFDEVFKK